jgi:tRNA U34 2-thiouridine synthase MnmA/TrmU
MSDKNTVKALVLLSGGLDSLLAAKILLQQGINVTGLSFASYFFGTEKAKISAKNLGIDLLEADFKDEHLDLVKNPRYGYGKNMNPCIDCHGLMFLQAGQIARQKGFDLIASGEVLGQRPMSQNRNSLFIIEKYAGLVGKILRPLSAKLLPLTFAEKDGLVDRNKFFAISGRSRAIQTKLAGSFGLTDYSSPGGGCLLTDPGYAARLRMLQHHWSEFTGNDVGLLRQGRVFWSLLPSGQEKKVKTSQAFLVIGRNERENQKIKDFASAGDMLLEFIDIPGPVGLLRLKNYEFSFKDGIIKSDIPKMTEMAKPEIKVENMEEFLEKAIILTGYFAVKARGRKIDMKISICH